MTKPLLYSWVGAATVLLALSYSATASSSLLPDSISYGYGYHIFDNHHPDIRQWRLGLRWQWDQDFLSTPSWRLNGYLNSG